MASAKTKKAMDEAVAAAKAKPSKTKAPNGNPLNVELAEVQKVAAEKKAKNEAKSNGNGRKSTRENIPATIAAVQKLLADASKLAKTLDASGKFDRDDTEQSDALLDAGKKAVKAYRLSLQIARGGEEKPEAAAPAEKPKQKAVAADKGSTSKETAHVEYACPFGDDRTFGRLQDLKRHVTRSHKGETVGA